MKAEIFQSDVASLIDQKLGRSLGLVILIGSNTSGIVEVLESIAGEIAQAGRKIFGILDRAVWSFDDPVLTWPQSSESITVDPKRGVWYPEEIKKVKGKSLSVLVVDQIKDLMTAEAVLDFALNESLVITSLRGVDAFSAVERLLAMGIDRAKLFSALTMIISLTREASGEVSYEILDRWSSK